jgi:hypothetical protein
MSCGPRAEPINVHKSLGEMAKVAESIVPSVSEETVLGLASL